MLFMHVGWLVNYYAHVLNVSVYRGRACAGVFFLYGELEPEQNPQENIKIQNKLR